MNPEGRTFYHKWQVEDAYDVKYPVGNGWKGVLREAELTLETMNLDSDTSFFKALLSPQEQKHVPKASEIHFGIVSARRTRSEKGLKGIATVQVAFRSAGIEPTWYVDADSLEEYRALGLKAVVGGKLTPARNMVLRDARKAGKACVEVSDDISKWDYRHGAMAKRHEMDLLNEAYAKAKEFIISPVTAARFMLAKLRSCPDNPRPRLGGVYCLGNCSRTMAYEPISRKHFIIGDFFVDDNSGLWFDESLTLKEDYDFTCQHMQKYGSVMRFMRLCVAAKHYSNEGGACAIRDAKGRQEQKNIAILKNKWPNAIFDHGTRKNEVKLRWKASGDDDASDDEDEEGKGKEGKGKALKSKKASLRRTVKKLVPKRMAALHVNFGRFKKENTLLGTGKESRVPYIAARCLQARGRTIGDVVKELSYTDVSGGIHNYTLTDVKYDIKCGFLKMKKAGK